MILPAGTARYRIHFISYIYLPFPFSGHDKGQCVRNFNLHGNSVFEKAFGWRETFHPAPEV